MKLQQKLKEGDEGGILQTEEGLPTDRQEEEEDEEQEAVSPMMKKKQQRSSYITLKNDSSKPTPLGK